MPLPSFAAPGATTFTFSKGDLFPARKLVTPRQRIGISNAGSVHVATLSVPEEQFVLTFEGLSLADYTDLGVFLGEVNWSGFPFTYTDVAAQAWLVRWVDSMWDMPETSAGLYSLTLTLKVELPWAGGGGDPEP